MDKREEKLRRLAQRHHLADDEAACIEDILDASRTYEPSGMVLDAELSFAANELRQLRAEVARLSEAQQRMLPIIDAALRLAEWDRAHGVILAVLDEQIDPVDDLIREINEACREYLEQDQRRQVWDTLAPPG